MFYEIWSKVNQVIKTQSLTSILNLRILVKTRNVFQRKTDVPPPTTYPFPSLHLCLKCNSTHLFHCPNLCFVDILFQVKSMYRCKYIQMYLKSFWLIVTSACHNYTCTKVLLLSTHWLKKYKLFQLKISKSYYDLENKINVI